MTKITEKKFIKALKESGGNQSIIAERMNVTRAAVSIFISRNPDMKSLCEAEGEKIIDIAENIIDEDIEKCKSIDSAKWKLTNSKRGKLRGYGPKIDQEITGSIQPTKIEIIMPNEDPNKADKETSKGMDKVTR